MTIQPTKVMIQRSQLQAHILAEAISTTISPSSSDQSFEFKKSLEKIEQACDELLVTLDKKKWLSLKGQSVTLLLGGTKTKTLLSSESFQSTISFDHAQAELVQLNSGLKENLNELCSSINRLFQKYLLLGKNIESFWHISRLPESQSFLPFLSDSDLSSGLGKETSVKQAYIQNDEAIKDVFKRIVEEFNQENEIYRLVDKAGKDHDVFSLRITNKLKEKFKEDLSSERRIEFFNHCRDAIEMSVYARLSLVKKVLEHTKTIYARFMEGRFVTLDSTIETQVSLIRQEKDILESFYKSLPTRDDFFEISLASFFLLKESKLNCVKKGFQFMKEAFEMCIDSFNSMEELFEEKASHLPLATRRKIKDLMENYKDRDIMHKISNVVEMFIYKNDLFHFKTSEVHKLRQVHRELIDSGLIDPKKLEIEARSVYAGLQRFWEMDIAFFNTCVDTFFLETQKCLTYRQMLLSRFTQMDDYINEQTIEEFLSVLDRASFEWEAKFRVQAKMMLASQQSMEVELIRRINYFKLKAREAVNEEVQARRLIESHLHKIYYDSDESSDSAETLQVSEVSLQSESDQGCVLL